VAIDYFVQYPCKVRTAITEAELLRMVKSRARATAMRDALRSDPRTDKNIPESDWKVIVRTMGPHGPSDTSMKISDLLKDSAPLDALAGYCAGCPANLQRRDFGCGGAIHYPITAAAEQWLVGRLPKDADDARLQLFLRACKQFGFDGAAIDAARKRKELYEASAPIERTWEKSFFSRVRVKSSQLLQMLVGEGSLDAARALLGADLLGFTNPETAQDNPVRTAQHDERTQEFTHFLNAAAFAGRHGVALLVDA